MNTVQKNTSRLNNQYECFTHSGKWEDGSILPKHEREADTGYSRRKAGFCSPDLYSYMIKTYGILWAKNPTRTDMSDEYSLFVDDCGLGMDLNGFLNYSLELSAVLGCVAIVMDADKEQPDSLEGMVLSRSFPFIEVVLPQNITQLTVDRVGRIRKFAYQYYDTSDTSQSILYEKVYEGGRVTKQHTETDKEGKESVVIDGISDLPMGRIPVVMMVPSREPLVTSRLPSSQTLGLYHQQYNVAITNSLIDENLYSQQFSVLSVISDASLKELSLGASNVMKLPIGSSASFISPSGTPIEMMLKRIESSVSMMIRTFANMLTNGTTQSGDAKVIDRQVGAMQLKNVANYMENVEYKIYELFYAFMGQDVSTEGYDYTVSYFKDFDLTDIQSYITQATDVLGLNISDEAKAKIRSFVLSKFLSGEDAEIVSSLVEKETKNIEQSPIAGVDDLQDDTQIEQIQTQTGLDMQVQNTALNGAQVTSLLEILAKVKDTTIPKASAKATIQSAFPAINTSLIDGMLNGINPVAPIIE